MKKYIVFILLVAFGSVSLMAQDKAVSEKKKSVDRVAVMIETLTKTYDLDEKQIAEATKIYKDSESDISAVKTQLMDLRTRKVNLDKENQTDVDAFNADYKKALEARKAVLMEREEAIDAILTDEQRAKKSSAGPNNTTKKAK